jgi:hypothetical protein
MVNFVITILVLVVGAVFFTASRKPEPVRLPVRITEASRKKR